MTAFLGEEVVRAVDALPGKVTKMEENHSLKESTAPCTRGVVSAAPCACSGRELFSSRRMDANGRFPASGGQEHWGYGWHRLTEPPEGIGVIEDY